MDKEKKMQMQEEIEGLRLQAEIHLLEVLLAQTGAAEIKDAADACQNFSYTK